MMPEVYLATVFVTTFVITALGVGFVALFFVPEIGVIDLWESQQIQQSSALYGLGILVSRPIDETKPGNGCPDYKTRLFTNPQGAPCDNWWNHRSICSMEIQQEWCGT